MPTTTRTITIPSQISAADVFGVQDRILRSVQDRFPELTIVARSNRVAIVSQSDKTESRAQQAQDVFNEIVEAAYEKPLTPFEVEKILNKYDDDGSFVNASKSAKAVKAAKSRRKEDERLLRAWENRFAGISNSAAGRTDFGFEESSDFRSQSGSGLSERKKFVSRGLKVILNTQNNSVRAKTAGQLKYVNAIDRNIITFGIGPAGTGKTYLAVAKAVRALSDGAVSRIILTRPAVEAGESLGYLPGTLTDKVDPYLRPLYDALHEMLGADRLHRFISEGTIEVAPLAYMRGRTLNDAFVILDEAQNTTEQQMKMFITRLGFNAKMIITGDNTQIDVLSRKSGLADIDRILEGLEDIAFVRLTTDDVVRHSLVGRIINAYEKFGNAKVKKNGKAGNEK